MKKKRIEYNCEVFQEYLVDYLDEDLPAELSIELEKHRMVCRECARLVKTLRRIIYELKKLSYYETEESVVARIHTSLKIKRWKRK
ncbi:MAG: zf-HC2 domain-containing protein [candidate division WOR-3 bacterium]|nr:zf-HC2 domain-containing protein [candidate division WOR-3 bacterium]MCX7837390.1 zf-HC2 domain-containing protein [candidate division WOR-3 bacterium]MDW8114313.1 zf-HC2 domain-containing protein [candidate division WOR-3 bacterium]